MSLLDRASSIFLHFFQLACVSFVPKVGNTAAHNVCTTMFSSIACPSRAIDESRAIADNQWVLLSGFPLEVVCEDRSLRKALNGETSPQKGLNTILH